MVISLFRSKSSRPMNGSSENAAITKVSEILLEDLISDKSFETMPSISMLDRLKS